MKTWLLSVALVTSLCAAPTGAPPGPTAVVAQLMAPQPACLEGTPVYLLLRLTNNGREPVKLFPLWQWGGPNHRTATPGPFRLEMLRGDQWVPVADGPWRRRISTGYRSGPAVEPGVLGSGETWDVWWDLTWSFELPPGAYRAWLDQDLGAPGLAGVPMRTERVALQVRAAEGREAELLALSRARARDRGGDRADLHLRPEESGETSYATWSMWQGLEEGLLGGMSFPKDGWPAADLGPCAAALLRRSLRADAFAPLPRVQLLQGAIGGLTVQDRPAPAWEDGLAARARVLRRSADVELAEACAWALCFFATVQRQRLNYQPGRFNVNLCEAVAAWNLPWWRLPPEQRPRFE
jgi:hypothetical protein